MTEQDPRETFQKDQEEARSQAEERDQTQWASQVRHAEAQASVVEAQAGKLKAQAELWTAITAAAWLIVAAALVVGFVAGIEYVVGWFQ